MRVYCGRHFSAEDVAAIRELIESNPTLKRTPLSRRICEMFEWRQPNGALKAMSCRVALLRMQADGLICLPPSQNPKNGRRAPVPLTAASDPQPLLSVPVHELPVLSVHPLNTPAAARLWNEYIARYHYLGYTPLSGSQLRYEIFSGDLRVALISFGARARTVGLTPEGPERRQTRQRGAAGATRERITEPAAHAPTGNTIDVLRGP